MTAAVYDPTTVAGDAFDRANHTGEQAQSTVTDLVSDLAAKAPLASPALTGTPTAPTAAPGTDTTQVATAAFVQAALAALIGGATPAALDTLQELADALGDDADFAGTVTTALATKLAKASNLSDLTDAAAARTNLDVVPTASVVQTAGDQAVAGVKTFSSSPIVPAPTTDLQAATKKYVDDNAGGGGGAAPTMGVIPAVGEFLLAPHTMTGFLDYSLSSTPPNSQMVVVAMPFIVAEESNYDAIGVYVDTANAGASATIDVAIYDNDGSGPGARLASASSPAGSSLDTIGEKIITLASPVVLAPGLYFAALGVSNLDAAGSNPQFRGGFAFAGPFGYAGVFGSNENGATGWRAVASLSDPWPGGSAPSTGNTGAPRLFIRRSA